MTDPTTRATTEVVIPTTDGPGVYVVTTNGDLWRLDGRDGFPYEQLARQEREAAIALALLTHVRDRLATAVDRNAFDVFLPYQPVSGRDGAA